MAILNSYLFAALTAVASISSLRTAQSFSPPPSSLLLTATYRRHHILRSSPADTQPPATTDKGEAAYEPPEDAIISIKPKAMARLVELKGKRDADPKQSPEHDSPLVLRMGVRNGGCSGLSYVMDFSTEDDIEEEDEVDEYDAEGIKCVVDAKSLLYLYGLELDYSDELIGGGFKFFNPNAEDSCGCGSSFGV
mmetsp:Transcript_34748/g.74010  ORF Transcript_34748/g.74010 Transcript_34748/m.74010 type:complete len:193 (-) Transcript_34748:366-944(-)|eukprot:CAMPEP_0172552998 /NCGR_PEP_ID=MMETSP1067-20121228/47746_1 /TAXON_ID=265564 ORGANISM="Thalassiosira punctigera, Strain Tpunct2005C2" /NCGR_SAMPLE_ID=MMETSP1067 /ASSEMBLY_ACC=CAM_ASM_000444 /LENGTH=192 /DNA_ID=CAMNT_0013341085 /DNA_START=104 /DNA_END=682 /DNA_ORIENTATION=-